MSQVETTLDHEYGETANLNVELDENVKSLIPLDKKYKEKAVLTAVNKLKDNMDVLVQIIESNSDYTAIINFAKLLPNNTPTSYEKIETVVLLNLNAYIQPAIRELLTNDGLEYKDYYRTDMYFTSSREGSTLKVIWQKAPKE